MPLTLPQLPAKEPCSPPKARPGTLKLSDLGRGETCRIIRVATSDTGCRKRFAEMGLAEGMKVTVTGTGDTLLLAVGGCKMGLSCRCAQDISVVRV